MTAAAGWDIYALVLDKKNLSLNDTLSKYGANKIIYSSGLIDATQDQQAEILAKAINEFQLMAIIGTASPLSMDIMTRISAITDAPLLSNCIEVDFHKKTGRISQFGSKAIATINVHGAPFLCTLHPNIIEPVKSQAPGDIINFNIVAEKAGRIVIREVRKNPKRAMDLSEASIILSGGRGVGSAENFQLLSTWAEKIGAALGASRAAVESGYTHYDIQIGQTGKTVSPSLYIACGISGTIQHYAGMSNSKAILAINTDVNAPIFSKCDYGIVGDLFEVLPLLVQKI